MMMNLNSSLILNSYNHSLPLCGGVEGGRRQGNKKTEKGVVRGGRNITRVIYTCLIWSKKYKASIRRFKALLFVIPSSQPYLFPLALGKGSLPTISVIGVRKL